MSGDRPKRRPFGDYEIGYGRPPEHSRFQPGKSGNLRGRTKACLMDLAGAIEKELAQKVTLTENGQRRRVTKSTLIAKQLVNKAAGGDLRAMACLQNLQRLRGLARNNVVPEEAVQPVTDSLSEIDWESMPTDDQEKVLEAIHILEAAESQSAFPVPPPRIPKREKP